MVIENVIFFVQYVSKTAAMQKYCMCVHENKAMYVVFYVFIVNVGCLQEIFLAQLRYYIFKSLRKQDLFLVMEKTLTFNISNIDQGRRFSAGESSKQQLFHTNLNNREVTSGKNFTRN